MIFFSFNNSINLFSFLCCTNIGQVSKYNVAIIHLFCIILTIIDVKNKIPISQVFMGTHNKNKKIDMLKINLLCFVWMAIALQLQLDLVVLLHLHQLGSFLDRIHLLLLPILFPCYCVTLIDPFRQT